jgi:DNA relaxase NicK
MSAFGLLSDGTLGYHNKGIFDKLVIRPESIPQYLDPLDFSRYVSSGCAVESLPDHYVIVDWLRFTGRGFGSLSLLDELIYDLTEEVSCNIIPTGKGRLGYSQSLNIVVYRDDGQPFSIGVIAYDNDPDSSQCGFMFDLTGAGCQYFREHNYLQYLAHFIDSYGLRITRLDLALDLIDTDYTVPNILLSHNNLGIFNSAKSGGKSLNNSLSGDWSPFVVGNVSVHDYDVQSHCPTGLTAYFGSRKSPNFFRVYEKGKQILGNLPEHDPSVPLNWVRVEHEWKYDKNHPPIPPLAIVYPDHYFLAGRGARSFLDHCYKKNAYPVPSEVRSKTIKHTKSLLLSHKVRWAKHQYGKLVKTLLDSGLSPEDVVLCLSRSSVIPDCIYDFSIE